LSVSIRFDEGIALQPQSLAASAESVRRALGSVAPIEPGALVALVGIGASEHVARSAAPTWRSLGIRAVAVSAAELQGSDLPLADVWVAMSESGRSAETVAALRGAPGRRLGITNDPEAPMSEVVDEVVPLDSGADSPIYTTGYTATLQAVGMLGEHWAGTTSDWDALPERVAQVTEQSRRVVAGVVDVIDRARIVDVVASGTSAATAGEGALMMRESARLHTASHETYNYLHGPMEAVDGQAACVVVGRGRELRLAGDLAGLGCPTLLITSDAGAEDLEHLTVLGLPEPSSPLAGAVLEILPLQLLAAELVERRGLKADGFRYHQDDIKLGRP
jgi:fructoselysine-6-P-deglycase FrlB-like protein